MSSALLFLNPCQPLVQLQIHSGSPAQSRRKATMQLAVVLSLLLHAVSYYWWGQHDVHPLSVPPMLQVTLSSPRPPEPAPVVVAPIAPAPVPPQSAKPEATPRPVPVRAAPRPSAAPIRVAAPPAMPMTSSAPSIAQIAKPAVRQAPGPTAEQLREPYLTRVFAHIERHKFYPGAARRQGLEGTVHVRFSLSAAGTVENLALLSGPKPLRHAAEQILRRAMPLPLPPPGIETPLRVEYQMPFRLN